MTVLYCLSLPLKTSENLPRFSDVFRRYRQATADHNGLKEISKKQFIS